MERGRSPGTSVANLGNGSLLGRTGKWCYFPTMDTAEKLAQDVVANPPSPRSSSRLTVAASISGRNTSGRTAVSVPNPPVRLRTCSHLFYLHLRQTHAVVNKRDSSPHC